MPWAAAAVAALGSVAQSSLQNLNTLPCNNKVAKHNFVNFLHGPQTFVIFRCFRLFSLALFECMGMRSDAFRSIWTDSENLENFWKIYAKLRLPQFQQRCGGTTGKKTSKSGSAHAKTIVKQ